MTLDTAQISQRLPRHVFNPSAPRGVDPPIKRIIPGILHLNYPLTQTSTHRPGFLAMADEAPILIVGAGPVGMLLAYQLDRMNVPCVIAEQNVDTTKWPKMDLTNCRSMELLRYLGLADDYRAQPGTVPDDTGFDTLFVTNLNPTGRLLSSWV